MKSRSNYYKLREESHALTDPLLSASNGVADSDEEVDSNESQYVRSRHSQPPTSEATSGPVIIVDKPRHPDDTIQAFAIRYRVPVCFT